MSVVSLSQELKDTLACKGISINEQDIWVGIESLDPYARNIAREFLFSASQEEVLAFHESLKKKIDALKSNDSDAFQAAVAAQCAAIFHI